MQDLSQRDETAISHPPRPSPSSARRLRGFISLTLFVALGVLGYIFPIADLRASASGPGWEASMRRDILITGGSRSGGFREVNDVPGEVIRRLNVLSWLDRRLDGLPGLVVGLGTLLSLRWRRGALFGGAASIVLLWWAVDFPSFIRSHVAASDWPGPVSLTFRPALAYLVAANVVVLLWHVVRLVLDRREERLRVEAALGPAT